MSHPQIDGLIIRKRSISNDSRGFFMNLFREEEFENLFEIKQVNQTYTREVGTIRGIHMQKKPSNERKIVTCIRGKVFDVIVDLRPNSSTFLNWFGVEISSDNRLSIEIPEGCGHGLQTLEPHSEMLYLHSDLYHPDLEVNLNPFDLKLNITWPLNLTNISEKDLKGKDLDAILPKLQ